MTPEEIKEWQQRVDEMEGPPSLVFNRELVVAVLEVAKQLSRLVDKLERL